MDNIAAVFLSWAEQRVSKVSSLFHYQSHWSATVIMYDTVALMVFVIFVASQSCVKHTYLAQGIPWSFRRFPQGEAWSLHSGWADLCDHPKCGWLGCVIYVSGGLRSRYPLYTSNGKKSHLLNSECIVHFIADHHFAPSSSPRHSFLQVLLSPVAQCVAWRAPMQQCVWWLVRAPSSS